MKFSEMTPVEREALPEATRKALDECKAKHGEAFLLELPGAEVSVVCRPIDRATYRRFRQERQGDPSQRANALEGVFFSTLFFPSAAEFDRLLDRRPALADSFGAALLDDISGAEDAQTKKG